MPSGGDIFGGLSRPGARESKTVNVTTEVNIPTLQVGVLAILYFIAFSLIFWLTTRLIYSERDWRTLVVIVHVVAIVTILAIISRYFDLIPLSKDWVDIGAKTVTVIILFFIADWYYSNVVPVIVTILMTDHVTVFLFGLTLSVSLAVLTGRIYYKRQLTDTLRDSDSAYAINAYNWEHGSIDEEKLDFEREKFYHNIPNKPALDAPVTPPLLLQKHPNATFLTSQEAFNTAFTEFLDGLGAGDFKTDESSWQNKVLPMSGYKVTAIGGKVRDALISAGWAMWNHPSAKNQGWHIRPDTNIEEIKRHVHDGKVDA